MIVKKNEILIFISEKEFLHLSESIMPVIKNLNNVRYIQKYEWDTWPRIKVSSKKIGNILSTSDIFPINVAFLNGLM